MATVLAYTSPALGNLFPMVAVLSELHRRGHRIVLKTLRDGVTINFVGVRCEIGGDGLWQIYGH